MYEDDDEIELLDDEIPKDLIEDDEDLDKVAELIKEVEPEATKELPKEPKKEDDDDKESYSRRVQKRLDKLVYERNVEREARAKDAEKLAALNAEQEELKAQIEELRQHRKKEIEDQSTQELESKRKALLQRKKEALEIGEYDEIVEIDDELMELKIQSRQPKSVPVVQKQTPQPATPEPTQPEPAPVANTPQAQQNWETNNAWIFDVNQKSRLEKANKIFRELLDDGYDLDDPDTYVQLDRKLKRETPPPAGAPDRGQVVGSNSKTAFTAEDKKRMAAWGLDPNDPRQRQEWIKNRK